MTACTCTCAERLDDLERDLLALQGNATLRTLRESRERDARYTRIAALRNGTVDQLRAADADDRIAAIRDMPPAQLAKHLDALTVDERRAWLAMHPDKRAVRRAHDVRHVDLSTIERHVSVEYRPGQAGSRWERAPFLVARADAARLRDLGLDVTSTWDRMGNPCLVPPIMVSGRRTVLGKPACAAWLELDHVARAHVASGEIVVTDMPDAYNLDMWRAARERDSSADSDAWPTTAQWSAAFGTEEH